MVICTKSIAPKAKLAFGKQNAVVATIENVIDKLALDPKVSSSNVEAFIVSAIDLRNTKIRDQFLKAVANKHQDVVVVYCARNKNDIVSNAAGINTSFIEPKPEELANSVNAVISSIEGRRGIGNALEKEKGIEHGFTPEDEPDFSGFGDPDFDIDFTKDEPEEVKPVDLPLNAQLFDEPEIEEEDSNRSELLDRIKECNRVADVAMVTKNITASEVVKDILKNNQQYAIIEDKLKALQEKIYTIFADKSIRSLEEKLEKVQALLVDKEHLQAKNNTIIEQRIEDIINVITSQTCGIVNERLKELDRAIISAGAVNSNLDFAHLAGITDERANLLLDIAVMNEELSRVYTMTDSLAADVASNMTAATVDLTGSPLMDAHLRMRHSSIVSADTINAITRILETANSASDEFKSAMRNLNIMFRKLDKLVESDKETIAALAQAVAFLRANNVEDTIVAQTLLKRALRVYVADEDSGRTVVPYIVSKKRARQNGKNVLYIDLTGTSKLSDYGEDAVTLEDWMTNKQTKEFLAVVGEPANDDVFYQSFLLALTKAADYYPYINVVMDPEQVSLFNNIAPNGMVVNYIVTPSKSVLKKYKDIIAQNKMDNVACRVIINKCDVPTRPIIVELGLLNEQDVHITKIPTVPALVECSMECIKPYDLAVVTESFREVCEVC